MTWLELKIPPLLVLVIFAALMWAMRVSLPELCYDFAYAPHTLVIFSLAGVVVALAGVIEFRRQNTTVDPTQPSKCSDLVTSGIYAFSRNPMYLGFLLLLVAWASYLSHALVWLLLPVFVWYLNRFQIELEEQALSQLFPETFPKYRQVVGRWI